MKNYLYGENQDKIIELFNSMLDGSTEYAMIATDTVGKIILWNKGAEAIYGYTASEMLGRQNLSDLHRRDAYDSDVLFVAEHHFDSSLREYSMNALRKDGTTLPVSVTITPRTNEKKQPLGLLVISRDITKIKLQERFRDVLLEVAYLINCSSTSDEMCTAAVDLICNFMDIPVAFICLLNPTGSSFQISYQKGLCAGFCTHRCNIQCEESQAQPCGFDCYATFSQLTINSGKLTDHRIAEFIEESKILQSDYALISIPLLTDVALIGLLHLVMPASRRDFLISDSQVLSLLANEISTGIQRKRLEEENREYANNLEKMVQERTEELRNKDSQLIQSGKLATLGEMATGIAHEINQPLGGISLMAQGLLMARNKGKLTDELLQDKLNSMLEQIERINKIISHLRTFARQSGDSRQEVNILHPLMDVFKLIGEQLKTRNIALEFDFIPDPPPVLADHNRLEQVFLNIIGNARDALDEFEEKVNAMKKTGDRPDWVDSWQKCIRIGCRAEKDSVVVTVTDNAGGIPEDVRAKIFEPFYTTKEVGKGTGLGLSISYGIVKEFGGTIEVSSEKEKGSTFTVRFPVDSKS